MTELLVDLPREETADLVEAAFENTEGINSILVSEHQIVGKTGLGFPRVLWSYGEKIHVDISDTNPNNITKITITGEKNVAINIGANPDKYKRRFINELNKLRRDDVSKSNQSDNTNSTNVAKENIIFCPHCGTENPEESNYCGECGGEMPPVG